MSRESRDRERRRFAENTEKWGIGIACIFLGSALLVPVFHLLGWL